MTALAFFAGFLLASLLARFARNAIRRAALDDAADYVERFAQARPTIAYSGKHVLHEVTKGLRGWAERPDTRTPPIPPEPPCLYPARLHLGRHEDLHL